MKINLKYLKRFITLLCLNLFFFLRLPIFGQVYSIGFCVPWDNRWMCSSTPQGFGTGTGDLSSLGSILTGGSKTGLIQYILTVSGLVLLVMIILSGYSLLTSAGNPEGMEKAKKRLTSALIGFIIIFAAFWIYQLVAVFIGLDQDFG